MTYTTCALVKDCASLIMKKKPTLKPKPKPVTDLSSRAGLVFPVEHFQQTLSYGKLPRTVEAAVFLTGVLEFLVAEVLTLAGQDAELNQSNKITLHHLPGLQDKKRYAKLLELSKHEEEEEEAVGVAT